MFVNRICRSPIFRMAAAALIALLCNTPAFCGEIHDAVRDGDLASVKALLKGNPALVSSKDQAGHTPLHLAAANGFKEVAELLLASKADIDARDNDGQTPLYTATLFDHKDVVELLLAHHADVKAKNKAGETPLQLATKYGYKDLVELLRRSHK